MSDILPVNQSVNAKMNINQNHVRPDQQTHQPANNFNIVDLAKVLKPNNRDDLADNSFLEQQKQLLTEKFFFNLVKEPGLAASSLKNIFNSYLILALSNKNISINMEEMANLVKAMTLDYSQMLNELFTQAEGMSLFKGEFFDILRLLYDSSSDTDFKAGIVKLLKGISICSSNSNVINSLKSNLKELMDILPERSVHYQNMKEVLEMLENLSKKLNVSVPDELSYKVAYTEQKNLDETAHLQIEELIKQQNQNADKLNQNFSAEKNLLINSGDNNIFSEEYSKNILKYLEEIKNSFSEAVSKLQTSPFATAETEKFVTLATYNLSFINGTPVNMDNLFASVLVKLSDNRDLANYFVSAYEKFCEQNAQPTIQKSDLIDSISKFITSYYSNPSANTIGNSEINNILRSLIAAPNSFTPLLHFILPMKYNIAQGFGELWVDPYEIAKDKKGNVQDERAIHVFFVADIMDIGYFETEIYLLNNTLNVNVLCPPDHVNSFKSMKDRITKAISSTTSYKFEGLNIEKLERKRALPQVFTKLSEKRDGFSVSV